VTTKPVARRSRRGATGAVAPTAPLKPDGLDAAILRFLRRRPNEYFDLTPLAGELGIDPIRMQLAVERLHRRRLLTAPFIEPGTAGGGQLTEVGLRWLIDREGGKPSDVPVALKPAKAPVRAADEAARLPRAQVYGVRR
jgi:hypothetical protein